MSFKQHIVNINDSSYIINPFGFVEGKKIEAQLVKYLAPLVAEMFTVDGEKVESSEDAKDADFSKRMISALHDVFEKHPVDEIVQFQCSILSKVQKDGRTIDLDKEFACEYDKAFELMVEVINFNFKTVFQKLGIAVA